jgi:hypothetical protein
LQEVPAKEADAFHWHPVELPDGVMVLQMEVQAVWPVNTVVLAAAVAAVAELLCITELQLYLLPVAAVAARVAEIIVLEAPGAAPDRMEIMEVLLVIVPI